MGTGIPDYTKLDLSGEALQAAERMELRAREPASEAMFRALVAPLLGPGTRRVLELGAGPATLARRIAAWLPGIEVFATDKSEGMLAAGARLLERDVRGRVHLARWDARDEAAFPFGPAPFDLIVTSVMFPYLSREELADLIPRLVARLAPGGVLAALEQNIPAHVDHPDDAVASRLSDPALVHSGLTLRLRRLMRASGLDLLPREAFLWTDEARGSYMRVLQERLAADGVASGRITAAEGERWLAEIEQMAAEGDFWYALSYQRCAGRRDA